MSNDLGHLGTLVGAVTVAAVALNPEHEVIEEVEFFKRAIQRFAVACFDGVVIGFRTGCPSVI